MSHLVSKVLSGSSEMDTSIVSNPSLELPRIDLVQQKIAEIGAQQVASTPEGRTGVLEGRKIENVQVFQEMKSKMCLVETKIGKASGFFINETGLLVTTFHCIEIETLEGGLWAAHPKNATVIYNGRRYRVGCPMNFNASRARVLDLCLLQIEAAELGELKTSCFKLLPDSFQIQEGMKAYFAGFPLTQSVLTFHKGHISSIFTQGSAQYFTIDGTVVQGNSGGPVVVVDRNHLYVAGVIFSEVADLDPAFSFFETAFKLMREQGEVGGIKISMPYPDGIQRMTSPLDIMSQCMTVVKRNMSTGIGKAIHIQHIGELLLGSAVVSYLTGPSQLHTLDSELPVVHGTLRVNVASREMVQKIPARTLEKALTFITSYLDSSEKKRELYSKLWGNPGTIARFDEVRLDRQSQMHDATNVQIQVGSDTIATLLVSNELAGRDDQAKIAEVINYTVEKFTYALTHYKEHGYAIVFRVDLKKS
jgi:hypothetical protein